MKYPVTYIILICLAAYTVAGCKQGAAKKKVSWNVTLRSDDKKPYGTYLSYQSLRYYFPRAKTELMSPGFRFSSIDDNMSYHDDSAALLVLVGLDFYISDVEKEKLVQFAAKGNEVMLFCSRLDNQLETALGCSKEESGREETPLLFFNPSKAQKNEVSLAGDYTKQYGMEGRSLQSYFALDTATAPATENSLTDYIETDPVTVSGDGDAEISGDAEVLGNTGRQPDFVRYKVGDGHITLHAAPLVLSNYFLLQSGNKKYLDGIWQTFPNNISNIYWTEYFKRHAEKASVWSLLHYPPIQWAFWLMIATLSVYVLFEAKRRQRIVPVVVPPINSSVTFAETVGRLYYNKGNHQNLAEKMVQHFLEWIRTYYYLNTNEINEGFIKQLTVKSGVPEATVREMINIIYEIRTRSVAVDEAYLYHLYSIIQQFYKNQ